MIQPKENTSIQTKNIFLPAFLRNLRLQARISPEYTVESFDSFCQLINDQLQYGGKKYAHGETKETTDLITNMFGVEWILGTVYKYVKRYQNLKREKDLLKIATYQFITWLQMGYHKEPETKMKNALNDMTGDTLDRMLKLLELFSKTQHPEYLLIIATLAYLKWKADGYHKNSEHETDTWNEKDSSWTKTPPAVAGYYAWRVNAKSPSPRVVEVFETSAGNLVYEDDAGEVCELTFGEFFGPLKFPD
jgi:hypothetical protein